MNRQWEFVVVGPLCGYQTHQHPNTKRAKRYVGWKAYVRLRATCFGGVPVELERGIAYEVIVKVKWKKAARIDADNILKGVTDALWRRDRGVLKASVEMGEHTGVEALLVIVIERWARKLPREAGRKEGRAGKARRSTPRPLRPADPYSAEFHRTNLR